MTEQTIIAPQAGPQTDFVNAEETIVFYGGAAGGGKSYALLMDALKHVHDPLFNAVYFRRTTKMLEATLWPEAKSMYMPFLVDPDTQKFMGKAKIREQAHEIIFPSGAKITFSYLDTDKDAELNWQGTQLTAVYYDEFCHFTEYQFNYLRTRLRSKSATASYVRASMNPDPDHFVIKYIEAFLDDEGFPDHSVCGKVRYFIVKSGDVYTDWDYDALKAKFPDKNPQSYTFIPSTLDDNPAMLDNNPDYADSLDSQGEAERQSLLLGNWYFRPAASTHFHRSWVEEVAAPPLHANRIRSWDLAVTEPSEQNKNPDWTAGVKMSKCPDGYYYIESAKRFRKKAGSRDNEMVKLAKLDGIDCKVSIPVDAGASGISAALDLSKKFTNIGFICKQIKASNKSKLTRFTPFSAAAQNGLVRVVTTGFTPTELDAFYKELEAFVGDDKGKDDQVDATADAFNSLNQETYIYSMSLPDLTCDNPFII